ncbi:type VI secretion system baseplate subunit TssE [Ideonella sp. DXS29W]|uniref:Type VI secretion system baseplate subunit TssE n=1 Tax=Ideonella lacteola TaxID=2984193 RepID=A0ABU9BSW6_9BURK
MSHYAPSLLDKLLGVEDHGPGKGTAMRMTMDQVKESVARDIEALLNAHACMDTDHLAPFALASRSILTLGLVDITSMSMASDRDRASVRVAISRTLSHHEPRLRDVEVDVRDTAAGSPLCFTIRAKLILSPDVEPVAFDAVLHPGSKRYAVSRSDRRAARALQP